MLFHTQPFYTQTLLNTHTRFVTQMRLHTDALTTLLHTDPCTQIPFYTQMLLPQTLCADTLLHTEALTDTQTGLHTDAFTHRRLRWTHQNRNFTVFDD